MISAEEVVRRVRDIWSRLNGTAAADETGGKRADEEQTNEKIGGGIVTVCAQGGLRIRTKPRGRYMQMIPDGTQLVAMEEKDGWLRVEYRGFTGWVSGEYCCKAGED